MFEPKDLSISYLKKFHKATREKIECAKEDTSESNKFARFLNPEFNQVKAEGRMVLRMLDEELDRRGYDVTKLFKGYKIDK
jgi:hypothetical protein